MKCRKVRELDESSYKAAKISEQISNKMFPPGECKTCKKRGHPNLFVTNDCQSLYKDDDAFIKTAKSKKKKKTCYAGFLIKVVKSCCYCCGCTACVARVTRYVQQSGGGVGGGVDESEEF